MIRITQKSELVFKTERPEILKNSAGYPRKQRGSNALNTSKLVDPTVPNSRKYGLDSFETTAEAH